MLDALADASLHDMAGATIFARGVAYAAEDRVRLIAADGNGAHFEVSGTQAYVTQLYFEDPGLHVACNCPHGDAGNFCKHMVAAALVWRQHLGGAAPPPSQKPAKSERSTKAAQTRAANREQLRAFVHAQPPEELADRLWKWAESDSHRMGELKAWAAKARANDDPKALSEAVNELLAFSRNRIVQGREVRAWAERARQVEPLLRTCLERSPESGLRIAEHALRRTYAAAQYIDDSGGEVGALMRSLIDIIVDAVQAAPPPAKWAKRFVALLDDDPYGLWDIERVLEVAGKPVADAFSECVAQRWDEVGSAQMAGSERNHARTRARDLVLADIRRRGDVAAELDFLRRTARGLFEHADMVRAFDRHGRHREAIQLAQAACKQFDNHGVIEDLLLEAYERDGWDDEAWQIRQRRFAAEPSVRNYQALLDATAAARKDVDAIRARAYAGAAAADQAETEAAHRVTRRYSGAVAGGPLVSATVALLLHDGELARALERVQPPNRCAPSLLEALVQRLPRSEDAAAFALMDRVVHAEMQRAQTPYTAALRAVSIALARLSPSMRADYVAQLKSQYKSKRNFVAGLTKDTAPQ